MALLQTCKITIGSNTYHFQTKKNAYKSDIATATGVEEVADTFNNDEPIIPIAQLILSNKLMRMYAECKNGNTTKIVEVLIRRDKVEEVMTQPTGSLEGKSFASFGTIKTVRSKTMDSFK
jgi:antitoxin component YwqK of YwqJK toxin-antitoxin module